MLHPPSLVQQDGPLVILAVPRGRPQRNVIQPGSAQGCATAVGSLRGHAQPLTSLVGTLGEVRGTLPRIGCLKGGVASGAHLRDVGQSLGDRAWQGEDADIPRVGPRPTRAREPGGPLLSLPGSSIMEVTRQ